MAQQIKGYGSSPFAEEALRISEMQKGQPGMARTSAPVGPNLQDSGGMSKPSVNAQPFNNERLESQNISENLKTRVPQAQAASLGAVRKGIVENAGKENDVQRLLADRVATMMYANDAGTATFQLGIPEVAALRHRHAAEQKVLAQGTPNLPMQSNNLPA